jgi:glutathione synthase/RimK-type ligase-like ATP-grasp enzyme
MILLWGLSGDDPLDGVAAALRDRAVPFHLLDQRTVLDVSVEMRIGARLSGTVDAPCGRLDLDEVDAVYVRVYDARRLPAVEAAGPEVLPRIDATEMALWAWADDTCARVVNRPSAMASNNSKPYQAALIRAQGFAVPETLITTDADAARRFWDEHRAVIYKSTSGVRSVVSRLTSVHLDRLEDVRWCPTQLQVWIAGRDFRAHVVGGEVFAVEVISSADDYRYAGRQGGSATLRACTLPCDVEDRCRRTAAALGLPLAGIDLRESPGGEWYCFEVNPSPAFTYYESHTGQPITAALASFLAGRHAAGDAYQ